MFEEHAAAVRAEERDARMVRRFKEELQKTVPISTTVVPGPEDRYMHEFTKLKV